MSKYKENLEKAVKYHGHLCSGQAIGVKMAMKALKLLNMDNDNINKNLLVYIECDRCISDAISTVTGCKIGKRSLKWFDFGKSAATFVRISDKKAYRIVKIKNIYPEDGEDIGEFFEKISDDELFKIEEVFVDFQKEDLPGKPIDVVFCEKCGEEVIDNKHVTINGKILCKNCAGKSYYKVINN